MDKGVQFLQMGSAFAYVCSYLTVKEKARLSGVHSKVRKLMFFEGNWGRLDISDYLTEDWDSFTLWLSKYLPIIESKSIQIQIMTQHESLLEVFCRNLDFVEEVSIFCESVELHLAIAEYCPNLTHLCLRSKILSDDLFRFMSQKLTHITSLEIVKDDVNFTAKNLSQLLTKPLKRLILKPYMVDFEELVNVSKQSSQSMAELELDVEECTNQQLIEIIEPLKAIEKLRLYHMENIKCFQELTSVLSERIKELCLTKTYWLSLSEIIRKVASKQLQSIDVTQCYTVTDEDLKMLASVSSNLKKVNLSWCNSISNSGVKFLIENCLNLQSLHLNGIKELNDDAFSEYKQLLPGFQEKAYDWFKIQYLKSPSKCKIVSYGTIWKEVLPKVQASALSKLKTLRKLRVLECVSCNSVSDSILKCIYTVNGMVAVTNYYNNSMGIYSLEEIGGDFF